MGGDNMVQADEEAERHLEVFHPRMVNKGAVGASPSTLLLSNHDALKSYLRLIYLWLSHTTRWTLVPRHTWAKS